jgi:hypothetical protein
MDQLPDRVNSISELSGALVSLAGAFAVIRGWRAGVVARGWGAFIAFLAAPVERDLAQRENRSLKLDNERLAAENDRLRADAGRAGGSSTSSWPGGDGTPTRP